MSDTTFTLVVKRDCPTFTMLVPVYEQLEAENSKF